MSAERSYDDRQNKFLSSPFLLKTFLVPILLFFGLPAMASPTPPVFSGGSGQHLTACANPGAINIDSFLTLNAQPSGEVVTWSVRTGPANGMLGGFNISAVTNDSALNPSGLSYTPDSGFSGTDSFTVQVSNGTDSVTTTLIVTVKPVPQLVSSLYPPSVCNGTVFNYIALSDVSGTVFAYFRPALSGISTSAASGTDTVNEVLANTTNYNITVVYVYTLTASGCSSTANVSVVVNPTPMLTGSLHDTVCSGALFTDSVSSYTAGTTFSWHRSQVAGLSPDSSSGTGNIGEIFINATSGALNAVYVFTLTANGCSAINGLTVTIEPAIPVFGITTSAPLSVCTNTLYQNFGTSFTSDSGVNYTWSAANATIFAHGSNRQYILVNFTEPGNAVITLTANLPGTSCGSVSSYSVTVGTAVSSSAGILYSGGQFVYLDNTQSSYQWGYDNVTTLDSTAIAGADFQSYPDAAPDLAHEYYWVITTQGGCMEKTYYNGPAALATPAVSNGVDYMQVYPNPASDIINIALKDLNGGIATVTISDMTGRTLRMRAGVKQNIQFDLAGIPAGAYMVTCFIDGQKAATTGFIKN